MIAPFSINSSRRRLEILFAARAPRQACFSSATATHAIARTFLGVPDLKFRESGAASPEEFRQIASAIAEKEDATQH